MENASPYMQSIPVENRMTANSPVSSLPGSHRKIERSCLMCHQRKIRCDKSLPCSHCVRADILCSYPEPKGNVRRPHKTTITEVAARVARLERTITAMSEIGSLKEPNIEENLRPTISQVETCMDKAQSPSDSRVREVLVQVGDRSRYFNEFLLARVVEEERDLRSVMETLNFGSDEPGKVSPCEIGGAFYGFAPAVVDTVGFHPAPWTALQLWRIFVNNVDPVVKILHIPTAQVSIYAAINNQVNIEDDLRALLFAIYFAATTSLSSTDAANMLGQRKAVALNKYKHGLEQALAKSDILDSPTIRSLQAMTIYLTSLRVYNTGRSGWTLAGLAIRMAQSIGLHRDGKNFYLSPFESEMRRRLWWYLCTIDARAAEDHGISLSHPDRSSDTSIPLNINDTELVREMQERPAIKDAWTEMTFSLIRMEACAALQQIHETSATPSAMAISKASMMQRLQELTVRLEGSYLKYCDQNIPIQRAALISTRLVIAKMEFIIRHQSSSQRGIQSEGSDADESKIISACRILEMNIQLLSDELLREFHWYLRSYTQYHVLTYVLWYLCVKPEGPNADRAWNAVESSFQLLNEHKISWEAGSKWSIVHALRGKATQIRQSLAAASVLDAGDSGAAGFATGESEYADSLELPDLAPVWGTGTSDCADFVDWSSIFCDMDMRGF